MSTPEPADTLAMVWLWLHLRGLAVVPEQLGEQHALTLDALTALWEANPPRLVPAPPAERPVEPPAAAGGAPGPVGVTAVPGPVLVCACGHNVTVHWADAGGCQKCECQGYTRPEALRAAP